MAKFALTLCVFLHEYGNLPERQCFEFLLRRNRFFHRIKTMIAKELIQFYTWRAHIHLLNGATTIGGSAQETDQ